MQILLLFIASVISFILAAQVISTGLRGRDHWFLFLLLALNSAYSGLLGFFLLNPHVEDYLYVAKLLFAVPAPMPVIFWGFAVNFPSRSGTRFTPVLFFHLFVATVMTGLCFTDGILRGVDLTTSGPRPQYGPLFPMYVLYFAAYVLLALRLFFHKYRDCKGLDRTKVKYALLGIGLGFFLHGNASLILPLAGVRYFAQMGPILTLPMLGILAYAMVTQRLLDVRGFTSRLLSLLLTTAFAGTVTGLLSAWALRLAQNLEAPIATGILITTALLAAGVASPSRILSDMLLRRFAFRQISDYHVALQSFGMRLGSLSKLDHLAELLARELTSLLGTRRVLIAYWGERGASDPLIIHQFPGDHEVPPEALERARVVLENWGDILLLQEIITSSPVAFHESARRVCEELKAVVLVKLETKGRVTGILALSEKKVPDGYTLEEINFLVDLGHRAATAMDNARLYDQLVRINTYIQGLLEHLTCGVVTVDLAGNITAVNSKGRQFLVVKDSPSARDSTIRDLESEIMSILRGVLTAGPPPTKEISFQEEGGAVKTITVGAAPLMDADGRLAGAIAVITDVTDLKLLEAEVRRVERLATVGTLAAGIAHEIKNPLVSLKTFAQLLPQKYDDPEFRTSFSQIASAEIERINSLVEQLLRFARPPKPIAVPIDIHEPLEGTLSLLSTEFTKKNISVTTRYYEGPLIVHGDSEQLRQVFMNILLNAVEALSPNGGGEIEITTEKRKRWSWGPPPSNSPLPEGYIWSDEEAVVRIEDNGPGIRESHLKYVFDPFFTTKDTGHGLGLSIAHNIVTEHHGSINADNRPKGGAAFTVTLPLLGMQEDKETGESHELRAGSLP